MNFGGDTNNKYLYNSMRILQNATDVTTMNLQR